MSYSVIGTHVIYEGVGILIQGESGAGKTECGLEIVRRGGRLVSDDIVEIRRSSRNRLIGWSPEQTKGLLDIKGVGLVHIGRLLGPSSVAEEGPLQITVELSQEPSGEGDNRKRSQCLLGIDLPFYCLGEKQTMESVAFIEQLVNKGDRS